MRQVILVLICTNSHLSNAVTDSHFSNTINDSYFSNTATDSHFSNTVTDYQFINTVTDSHFSNTVTDTHFSNAVTLVYIPHCSKYLKTFQCLGNSILLCIKGFILGYHAVELLKLMKTYTHRIFQHLPAQERLLK